jgi:hypothetical protein
MVVPDQTVKRAESEGLDRIFLDAGLSGESRDVRLPGDEPDILSP